MSRPRLCLHCKKPIAPRRGRPSDFCEPAHKLAWKAAQKSEGVRRGRAAGRAVEELPAAKLVGRRPGAAMSDAKDIVTLAKIVASQGARLAVLEGLIAGRQLRSGHAQFEPSGEGLAQGPVSRRHVPAAEVRQC